MAILLPCGKHERKEFAEICDRGLQLYFLNGRLLNVLCYLFSFCHEDNFFYKR